ncbi:MAG: hypothetical protein ACRBB2_00360, partial [Nitrosopumilus sp.]
HKQWKKFSDPDMLTCKSDFLLLQKYDGKPVCVTSNTYLKLVDRGFGSHNQSMIDKRPGMMNHLMQSMMSNEILMFHWHQMMQKNPVILEQTLDTWILQMNENSELLKNILGPIMSDNHLRDKMVHVMKNHDTMENHLKMNSKWMISVHQPITNPETTLCTWCPDYQVLTSSHLSDSNSDKTMEIIHHVWINSEMTQDMHTLMLENPSHMYMMSTHMMEPILFAIMNDQNLQKEMVELMLDHDEFMNTIRHDNPQNTH